MIPVAGRPVIYWTLTYLRSLGLRRFCIAVPQRGLFVEDFVDCTVGRDCDCDVYCSRPPALRRRRGNCCKPSRFREHASALVVLGDTYLPICRPGGSRLITSRCVLTGFCRGIVPLVHRGTAMLRTRSASLFDKQRGLTGNLEALIGVYYFPDAAQARRLARQQVTLDTNARKVALNSLSVLDCLHARDTAPDLQSRRMARLRQS